MEFHYSLKLVNDGWVLREKSDFDAAWDHFWKMAKRGQEFYLLWGSGEISRVPLRTGAES